MNFRFAPPLKGVFASMGSLFHPEEKEKPQTIDVDEDGKTLFKEDIIQFVLEALEKRRQERFPIEQQWILNSNFLIGNQYCEINTYRGEIEQLEPVYDWLERETFNQIAPLIETRIANLKKIHYMMKVKPRTNELDDYAKAEVSTAILQHIQSSTDFETQKNTMISWNELCGNCFWLSWWDKDKGDQVGVQKVTVEGDDGSAQEKEVGIYAGDLDYGLITPYEIYPESIFKQTVEAQRSIILEQVKSVEDIYDLYGIRVEGGDIETFELTPVAQSNGLGRETTVMGMGHRKAENAQKVITYFERPSKHRPDGRMIIIVGDEHLIYYGELPYQRIPIVQCICREIPGQFFGKSVIEDLIPRQRAYNGCMNRIHEYLKRIALQGYLVEEGSIDADDYEENGLAPGALLRYKKGYNPPVPIANAALPGDIMTERYNLVRDMEYVAGVSQLTTSGAAPSGVTSGVALEAIRATDDTRLSLTGDYVRNCVKKLAVIWLELYKRYAVTKRVVDHMGTNNFGSALVWSREDITSFDIEYTTENELLMSEEMQKQRFFEAYNAGFFTDANGQIPQRVKQKALEYTQTGDYGELMNINLLQLQAAQRENVFFENGSFPEVSEFDDHDIHMEEHLRYILQMRFRVLKMKKPEYAAGLEAHLRMHKEAKQQEETARMMAAMGPMAAVQAQEPQPQEGEEINHE